MVRHIESKGYSLSDKINAKSMKNSFSQHLLISLSSATELSENCVTLCKRAMVFCSFQEE